MPHPTPTALTASRVLLQILRFLNALTGVGLVLAIPATFLFEPTFTEFFSKKPARIDPGWLLPTLRIWMVFAIAMVATVHVSLTRLLEMVATVGAGDPFVPDNAVRLNTIAWCTLVVQVLHLAFGLFAATMNAAGSSIDFNWSLTGWVTVALLFVLARVFEAGTRMRDDLESMI